MASTKAILLVNSLTVEMLADMVRAGLASAT